MKLRINGEPREVPGPMTVAGVLRVLGVDDPRGIAVAVGDEVLPRGTWDDTLLQEGQSVEVLRAVQGG